MAAFAETRWMVVLDSEARVTSMGPSHTGGRPVHYSISAHHPRPFFALFRQVDDWLRRYFAGGYQLIDAEDMRMFIDRSSNFGRTSNLRTLFYPVWPDDFNITMRVRVSGDVHRLNVTSLKDAHRQGTDPGFPDLERPVTINGTTYYKRRPDFLSRLTDALYHRLFTRLKSLDEDAVFPNWSKVMKDDTQHTCQVFSSVMKHMMLELTRPKSSAYTR